MWKSSGALEKITAAVQNPASWNPQTDSLAMTWPQPDMLRQVVERLNQWLPTQAPPANWRFDPLVGQLPPSLRKLPPLEDAAAWEFSSYDGFMLEEAVWLNNLSDWARGKTLDDLDRARKLFDWTVRNIQLDEDEIDRTRLLPREVLLLGHGSALERAWVFMLLARQQGLDTAVVALDLGAQRRKPPAGQEGKDAPDAPVPLVDLEPWFVTVLVNGNLYLFDPKLGLPIPAPGPIATDSAGQLDIHPATLAQVIADDKLLRRLDRGPKQPFPLTAADLKHVVLLVEGSPQYLAKRMQVLESRLAGKQHLVLTARPAAQARRLVQATGGHATAQLWVLPYDTLQRRLRLGPRAVATQLFALLPFFSSSAEPLYRGRVLHLKGRFAGEQAPPPTTSRPGLPTRTWKWAIRNRWRTLPRGPGTNNSAALPRSSSGPRSFWTASRMPAIGWAWWPSSRATTPRRSTTSPSGRSAPTRTAPGSSGPRITRPAPIEASGQFDKARQWYSRLRPISPSTYGNLLRAAWLGKKGG